MSNQYLSRPQGISRLVLLMALFSVIFPPPAHSEELFQFIQKWPVLEQPWYFQQPKGIAIDAGGNVYVADSGNDQIQKFTASGVFLAKWGSTGSGLGQFSNPQGIAVDASGNVYVADTWNHRIQKFSSSGSFQAAWGVWGSGNGQFGTPSSIAVDSAGNVYVADTGNSRVQKFTCSGGYVTKWGTRGSGNGQLDLPEGIAVDSLGYVYVADTYNHRIQKFTSAGVFVTTWGTLGHDPEQLHYPEGVAVDTSGNVYVADTLHSCIKKFSSSGVFIDFIVFAGNRDYGVQSPEGLAVDASGTLYIADTENDRVAEFAGDGDYIAAWSSQGEQQGAFDYPLGLAVDASSGSVYVVDSQNDRIQKFNSAGVFIAAWGTPGTDVGELYDPEDIAVDGSGNVYVADTNNNRIQKYTAAGILVTTWGSEGDASGQFEHPRGIAVDSSNNVYVSDAGNNRIQVFTSTGAYLTQWGSYGHGNGQFDQPQGLVVDSSGTVYVADTRNHRIQKFTYTGTFLTAWGTHGSTDGCLDEPHDVAIDGGGNVYVSDSDNNRIQKFTSTGDYLTQWGSRGSADGQFVSPESIAVAGSAIYVSDSENNHIQTFWHAFTLYYPHCDASNGWDTEIAVINTNASQTIHGIMAPMTGSPSVVVPAMSITLPPHARRQIDIGSEFPDAAAIQYLIFFADAEGAKGYTKFSQDGLYRVGVPAVSTSSAGDIIIPHIASDDTWWTGIALVNTTASAKNYVIAFDNAMLSIGALNPYEHRAFTIESLFGGSARPDLHSGVLSSGEGIIGLELFGSTAELGGIPLSDATDTLLYYPHVASNDYWWTGVVAYNTSSTTKEAAVLPFSAEGAPLTATTFNIGGYSRASQEVSGLGLPAEAAWFMVTCSAGLSGFELFGTRDGNAMAGVCSMGTRGVQGVFAKLEKSGWTGIALVNTVASAATVTLSAYDDSGTVRAVRTITLDPFEKVVEVAENLFPGQDLRPATYIGYASTQNLVGFQLNGSEDGTMLDGLPGM